MIYEKLSNNQILFLSEIETIAFYIKKEVEIIELQSPPFGGMGEIKTASYLHRTAQPFTLATFRSWGNSTGAGRIRLAGCKYRGIALKLKI